MITTVYVWQNGMVMVFDDRGQQLPEYQGRKAEMLPLIMAWIEAHPELEVIIHYNASWPI